MYCCFVTMGRRQESYHLFSVYYVFSALQVSPHLIFTPVVSGGSCPHFFRQEGGDPESINDLAEATEPY